MNNGVTIEVKSPSIRSVRGPTYVGVLCDEIAFWRSDESANPDSEVLAAVRPGLATTGGPLFCISSPYSRRGVLWEAFKKYHGAEGDPLIVVAQAPSRGLNPSLAQSVVDRALARDPLTNAAEYMATFRCDLEMLLTQEAVNACIDPGIRERPPEYRNSYVAFVDPSGGSSDSFTLGIAHKEGETEILDLLRERRPPFSPEEVVEEFASTISKYRCARCFGDRYAGSWPSEQFSKRGVHLEPAEKPKSEIYQDLVPLINSGAARLLDNERLTLQLVGLERVTRVGGKDRIDHARGQHDDLANAAAGALVFAYQEVGYSPGQQLRDNMKIAAHFKRYARSFV